MKFYLLEFWLKPMNEFLFICSFALQMKTDLFSFYTNRVNFLFGNFMCIIENIILSTSTFFFNHRNFSKRRLYYEPNWVVKLIFFFMPIYTYISPYSDVKRYTFKNQKYVCYVYNRNVYIFLHIFYITIVNTPELEILIKKPHCFRICLL